VLEESHPYRALAEGTYRLTGAGDDDRWAITADAAAVILAANVDSPQARRVRSDRGRGSLCTELYFLSVDGPDVLKPLNSLDEETIQYFIANEGKIRRSTHRSRTALASHVRSMRFGFPELFPSNARYDDGNETELAPIEDWQFEIALAETAHFRNPETRLNMRAVLHLGRGAGCDGGEMPHIAGIHVERVPSAGTWLRIVAPGGERFVPVLARHADALEDLACARNERCLIAKGPAPCDSSQPSVLCGELSRSLRRHGHDFRIYVGGLRKAWMIEQVSSNCPMNTFLQAAGLKSLRTFERLLRYAPRPPDNLTHLAYELGGVEHDRTSEAR
jgi:hypothetical protein